jgi:transcriptional regulator with XRE-family HTH domain|tara:strand:- start:811 stop:1146 length:336 start_codon:yes stop_codon:yes gene_type:complete
MKNSKNKARKELGSKIRTLRNTAGYTQERLGKKAGLSYKYIGELERGRVNVSLDSLEKITSALGVNLGNLFSKDKVSVQKVFVKEKDKLSGLSKKDIQVVKNAMKILSKVF